MQLLVARVSGLVALSVGVVGSLRSGDPLVALTAAWATRAVQVKTRERASAGGSAVSSKERAELLSLSQGEGVAVFLLLTTALLVTITALTGTGSVTGKLAELWRRLFLSSK